MLAIVDYGVGNLFSLCSSFDFIGEKCVVSGDPEVIRSAERIILPGVGAFADAAEKLRERSIPWIHSLTHHGTSSDTVTHIMKKWHLILPRSTTG